jgi:hypothetical protein
VLFDLGALLAETGNLTRAQVLLERALVTREAALGAEHGTTAATLRALGALLSAWLPVHVAFAVACSLLALLHVIAELVYR